MAGKRNKQDITEHYDDFVYDELQDGDKTVPAYRYSPAFRTDKTPVPRYMTRGAKARNDDEMTPEETEGLVKPQNSDAEPENSNPLENARQRVDTINAEEEAGKPVRANDPDEKKPGLFKRLHKLLKKRGFSKRVRLTWMIVITVLLTGVLGVTFAFHIWGSGWKTSDDPVMTLVTTVAGTPEELISSGVSPVQTFFSGIANSVDQFFRRLILRSHLEEEYARVVQENDTLTYRAMRADELEIQLSQFQDIYDEVEHNHDMQPIACAVIGKEDGNYFSVFTINHGSKDGIEPYMAVTSQGALIGYTENVKETSSTVRTIIDSSASIAGIIQSSRDQGTVSGTLGIDGTPMCRMYYLSDDDLPRPGDSVVTSGVGMSFPKGIPIGTVRESTRGMDSNKQFIVIEPNADFTHVEYVLVLRYQPLAEPISGRDSVSSSIELTTPEPARPYPTLRMSSLSIFATETTEGPETTEVTPAPTASVTETPTPTPGPTPTPAPTSDLPVYEYHPLVTGPTPTPTPEPTPTPTPYITLLPGDMTYEDD